MPFDSILNAISKLSVGWGTTMVLIPILLFFSAIKNWPDIFSGIKNWPDIKDQKELKNIIANTLGYGFIQWCFVMTLIALPHAGHPTLLMTAPPSSSVDIIGRNKELGELHKMISNNHFILISGCEGIGKSTLTKKLFSEIQNNYYFCGWIPYETNLKKSFSKNISWDKVTVSKEELDRWWNTFAVEINNAAGKKLFVINDFDNISNEDWRTIGELRGWRNTTVILTSRQNEIEGFTPYLVGPLREDDSVKLFCYYYKDYVDKDQKECIKKLANLVHGHPLLVELLAKSAKYESTLSEFYEKLENNNFSASTLKVESSYNNLNETLEKHLKELFRTEKRSNDEQAVLSRFLKWEDNHKIDKKGVKEEFGNKINALDQLVKNNWLSFEEKEKVYFMPPLVKKIIQLNETMKEKNNSEYPEQIPTEQKEE